ITLVWTVHPLHHESVNMLTSGLGFLSSTLFMLLAINLSLYSPYDSSMNPNLASLIRMLSYLCFAISFIGVEMVLIGPIVLIMILLAMNKVASRWAQMLAPLIVLANYFVIRFSISAETKYFSMSLAELAERSLVLAPQIFLHYLKLFFYPAQLGVDQHHNLVLANAFSTNHYLALAACTVLLAVIVYFFWIQDSRINLLIAGFGCFSLLGIAVTLNIYPVYCLARDRYTYFFVLGLVAVLILLAEKYFKLSTKPKTGMALIAIVVLALGTRSWYKNFDWHNGEKLWQHTIASVDDIGAKQIWRYSLIHYYEDSKTKPNRSLLEDFAYFIERNNLDQPEVYQQIMTKVKAPENYLEQKYGYADNKTIAAALYVLAERQLRFGYQDESQRTLFLSRKYYPKYFQTNMAIYLSDFYMALERQQQEQIALDLAEVAAQNRLWGRQLEEVVK
ncbi:MAG: hypothetical protein OXU45_05800, partial [Candidatus Melainabacteria bacterium]|nr:hypothetical protein [Candidatus Melainabacteria bacterium]